MTWDTFLTLRSTKGIYLDHVATLKNHKILVTSPEAKFLFSLFGAFWGFLGLWALDWALALGLSIENKHKVVNNIFCSGPEILF